MSLKVFGITGTNGKTTVSYILRNILKTAGKKSGLIGTISHQIGENEYESINTTPGEKLLLEYFSQMIESNTDCCVMEVSSHGLAQGRVDKINIDYAGFTNLTQDHLDYHHTMEEYYEAKKKLFLMSKQVNIINVDDPYGKRLFEELEKSGAARGVAVSIEDKSAGFFGEIEESAVTGSKINFYENGNIIGNFTIKTPGRFSIYNAMLAAGLARCGGIGFDDVKSGIETLRGVPGRFEVIQGKNDVTAIVDYAHTPDALENILKTASEIQNKGRLLCVFGCGGNRDKDKRKKMGLIAGSYSDYVIITNDNPRSEDPEDIAAEIEEGVYDTGCDYHIILDRYQAIKRAASLCRKGDIIIIAGKGHESYQIIGNEKRPFNDKETVMLFLT